MRYVFLPPYSPDFNPIELAFSSIKAHLKRKGLLLRTLGKDAASLATAIRAVIDAVWTVTPGKAAGWFRHCGY
jgi:hypothetical protein